MKYEPGGELVRHYDSTFDFADGRRTLMSVILYLSDDGSPTRLLIEPQRHLPVRERDFSDADAVADATDVLASITPAAGTALLLDHRIPHDVPPASAERLVLRTDVVYVRCGIEEQTPVPDAPAAPQSAAAWRISRDAYYRDALDALGSVNAIAHAGYFDDGRQEHDDDGRADPRWMSTPLDVIQKRLASAKANTPLVVLLATGGFYPVHRGHTAMMDLARAALEERGHHVLGGYLSPGHDDYVRSKSADAPSAEQRLRLCENAVADSDWLMVDSWESLHTGRAVNFTEVIARLEAYLSRHVRTHRRIEVAYVFGGDNARFAGAFIGRGLAVCVPRPGYAQQVTEAFAHPLVRHNPRIILTTTEAPDAASRAVRTGDATHLSAVMQRAWSTQPSAKAGKLLVRDEGDWPLQDWLERHPKVSDAMRVFSENLKRALARAFEGHAVAIETVLLDHQREQKLPGRILSLDPCFPGDANLGVSRAFAIASPSTNVGLVARPGWPSLEAQVAAIPPGTYTLLDDDASTGETLRAVQRLLPPHVRIGHVATLSNTRDGVLDLVDSRDFLAGARDAGLVVTLPTGDLARVPYALPYVRPSDRYSVPEGRSIELSRTIWQLNHAFFTAIPLQVGAMADPFRTLCRYLEFPGTTPMHELCTWHIERLAG